MRGMESCELPERSIGLARTSGNQRTGGSGMLRGGGGEPHGENVYLPLAMHMEPRGEQQQTRHAGLAALEVGRGTTPDTEPPPAYHDLFPVGYKFSPDKIEEEEEEEASHSLVLSSLKEVEEGGNHVGLEVSGAGLPSATVAGVAEAGSRGQQDDALNEMRGQQLPNPASL